MGYKTRWDRVSRVGFAKRNIISGIVKQMIHLVLAFVIRTAIIYILGVEYQGLNGLFTSILHVLNLTDLGFSTAVTYILYKPIAAEDNESICAIINYLKKVYWRIGVLILGAGLCLTPFLTRLINDDIPSDINIYLLFLVYLFNTSITYFLFAYKSTLLTAMQRQDLVSNAYTLINTTANLLQLLAMLLFRHYYAYICLMPLGTIANSIMIQYASKKKFPEIVPKGEIDSETKKELTKQIKAVFIGRISDVARNSFDNIVLSMLLGLAAVTIYDNYYYIYNAIYGVMGIIIHGIMASVGNSIAVESVEKNYKDLQKFNFIFMWIVSWCSICLLCLYQPFMSIWMKGKPGMFLSDFDMLLFCLYFYSINMTYVRSMYLDGYGLFHECRFTFIAEALSNLLLNFTLGYFFGVTGIILATILTIFVLNFITRTNILFKYYFVRSPWPFYFQNMFYFIATVFAAVVTSYICNLVMTNGIWGLFIRLALCVVIPNMILLIFYFKHRQFKESYLFVRKILRK